MPMPESAPPEVIALAERRVEHRAARDFAAADELRGQIAALGWTVVDAPSGGFALDLWSRRRSRNVRGCGRRMSRRSSVTHPPWMYPCMGSSRGGPKTSFAASTASVATSPVSPSITSSSTSPGHRHPWWPGDVERVELVEDTGWAAARNTGLHRSLGEIVTVVDGSIEVTGPVLEPIRRALADPSVGSAGRSGSSRTTSASSGRTPVRKSTRSRAT